jgi:hypothetical protein
VDADPRHQTCPRCGFTSRENRPKQGLLFLCQQCGYTLHADLVGARNIALRTLVIRQDWMATGKPVSCPPRDQTTKPKQPDGLGMLQLRWSSATSPARKLGVI